MTQIYFVLALINAVVSLAAAVLVFWKNRFQTIGPLFGATMLGMAVWLMGFAQYFRPVDMASAIWWGKFTLIGALLIQPLWFQTLCALAGRMRRFRWWIGVAYFSVVPFAYLIWYGDMILGLRHPHFMDHYLHYNPDWYLTLVTELVVWQWFGIAIVMHSLRRAVGYKRTQLIYFVVAWLIVFLTIHAIIMVLEYDINIQPFGFFLLPINLALLAYVMAKARLSEFNVVFSRVLVHTMAFLIIVVMAGAAISAVQLWKPDFLAGPQTLFVLMLVTVIGGTLSMTWPRLIPKAERVVVEKLFGAQVNYQELLRALVNKISSTATVDDLLHSVLELIVTSLRVSRGVFYQRDDLSGQMALRATLGGGHSRFKSTKLSDDSLMLAWMTEKRDCLVADELPRRAAGEESAQLQAELKSLGLAVCVPMILEDYLVGFLGLAEKQSGDMFYLADLQFLETVLTETALALRYRKMQEEVFRKNRLVELGTIAAGVAHEIRNPLSSIRTFVQLLPERIGDPEFQVEFGAVVRKDVDRITHVVESMLAFARPSPVTVGDYSGAELVDEALLLVQPRLKTKRVELAREFHDQPMLRVDKHQILQVLVNLLNNAIDAAPSDGHVLISTGVRAVDGIGGNGNRKRAIIEVTDNGPGVPAAVRNRLFDPFFTTKKEGTGLGLSISQKIVRDHGGVITVSSVEGKGTTFQIHLPLT